MVEYCFAVSKPYVYSQNGIVDNRMGQGNEGFELCLVCMELFVRKKSEERMNEEKINFT